MTDPLIVDELNHGHTDRVWVDNDGYIWAWNDAAEAWSCWQPGNWEAETYLDPNTEHGPFTLIGRKPND